MLAMNQATEERDQSKKLPPRNLASSLLKFEQMGILIAVILLWVILAFIAPHFLSWQNIINIGLSISYVGVVAAAQTIVLIAGGFDLSVGSTAALAGIVAVLTMNASHNIIIAIIGGLLVGMAGGLFNGLSITKLKINALITTLATMSVLRGIAFLVSGGSAIGVLDREFYGLGIGQTLGIPNPVIILVLIFIAFHVLLNYTRFGRELYVVGGNPEAARLSGINVDKYRVRVFIISGAMAALTGIILASRMTSGQPTSGQGLEMDSITAAILGGTALAGGQGRMIGTVFGMILMGTVDNGLNLLNVPAFYQYIARGLLLLFGVAIDQLRARR
ncbi:ribose ABC transporter permease [Moorella naiadis]|uniref:ABC transporter permease n=1 Tax=Moorella naiadis (nom. illeg.) TaxID=3093670 RepID=UPI003D9CB47E